MATTFKQVTQGLIGGFPGYLWGNAANWTNGVPANGDTVVLNQTAPSNPSGYDDIASLRLDTLTLAQGYLAVTGSLEIGNLTFGAVGFDQVYATTLPGNASALLTVDSLGSGHGGLGQVGATGLGAVANVVAPTDPGTAYFADDGGEIELTATPNAASTYAFENSVALGTIAFRNPGATVAASLFGVAAGDAIALPGSSVSAVSFGTGSLSITTNLGTTTFTNVFYQSAKPTGYTVSADPTGLERVTFAAPKTTTFQQGAKGLIGGFLNYLWSNAANWTNGVPVNGDTVVLNQATGGNPSGYDDIAGLYLDTLTLAQGYLAVTGSLEIGHVTFGAAGFDVVYATTLPGNASALLTIDSLGSGQGGLGQVGAFGPGAVTNVVAPTDPGVTYTADDGGEIELAAAPNAGSRYAFENSVASGTIAFRNPGATIAGALFGVAAGDAIALPGSSVSAVSFGAGSLNITTNLGTTTFSNVFYQNATPTGYTVSADPTGLERITFAAPKTTTFQQGATGLAGPFTAYLWSNAANWTNGVPVNGDTVVLNQATGGNPSGYDDIAGLYLDTLTLAQGYLAVTGSLEIGHVTFGAAGFDVVYATTLPGNASALLTIDSLGSGQGGLGQVGAFGPGAVTNVVAPTDPGVTYTVDDGGEIELAAAPNAGSRYAFENSVASGTIAFRNPGATIAGALFGVAAGDAIALPGSSVSAVSFGAGSLSITTNLGTTTFSNVFYQNAKPTFYTVTTDPTGLERLTFAAPKTTTFQQVTTGLIGGFPGYLWSNAANWTNGVPLNGEDVVFNQGTTSNPDGYDDIAHLSLDALTLAQGYLAVTGSLEIASLTFGNTGFAQVYATTLPGNAAALLTVDGLGSGNGGFGQVGATGPGAVTNVVAPTDPGVTYFADDGGEIELAATPNAASQYAFNNSVASATIAFRNPGANIAGSLFGVAAGDAIALPGSSVSAVSFGASTMSITTNLGVTTFSKVFYQGATPTGYIASADPTGLERVTFAASKTTTFQRVTQGAAGNFTGYLWSNAANWTNGVPGNGDNVVFNQAVLSNPSGYDDIATLSLDTLNLAQGYLGVTGSLEIGHLTFGSAGLDQIYAFTLPGNASALLTVDSMGAGGSFGQVGAVGVGAVTNVVAPTDPGVAYFAQQGGELELTATPNAASSYGFSPFAIPTTIAFRNPGATVTSSIFGIAQGAAIALPGSSVSAVSFGASSISITTNLGATTFSNVSYTGAKPTGYAVSADPTGLERVTIACYAHGTLILTDAGEVPVESLAIGDRVITADGTAKPIRWIGRRNYAGRFLAANPGALPIRIRAGALGSGLPRRDLLVSPEHAMLLDGLLVPARHLVNGTTVARDAGRNSVSYVHIELAAHDAIRAEGAWSETFLDDESRGVFHNAHEHAALCPDALPQAKFFAPRVESGYGLENIRTRLAEIASRMRRAA